VLTFETMRDPIGKPAQLIVEGFAKGSNLHFDVEVSDAKLTYGRIRLLIKPVAGSGEQWVESGRLAL
jgi:hypothetical protein